MPTLEELEAASSAILSETLLEPRRLLSSIADLLGQSSRALRKEDLIDSRLATRVNTLLIIRLTNDARCVSVLARMGYGLQAASVASSIYELSYTSAYIGADNELAKVWQQHEEVISAPFGSMLKLTEGALVKLGIPSAKTEAPSFYRSYTQLCMAKHGNPLLQGHHGLDVENELLIPKNGPDTSDKSIRVCWFALEKSASALLIASRSFITNHVPSEKRVQLIQQLSTLVEECIRIRDIAVARWGNEDPAPGKWKT